MRNLFFLVPPASLEEHIYRVSVILRKRISFRSPLVACFFYSCFDFTYLYHRYPGEAIPHSLKEAVEDQRKRGKH